MDPDAVDITDYIRHVTTILQPGKMLVNSKLCGRDVFCSAVEICDPRVDVGMNPESSVTMHRIKEENLMQVNPSFDDSIFILDRFLQWLIMWLYGKCEPMTTLQSCIYLHDLETLINNYELNFLLTAYQKIFILFHSSCLVCQNITDEDIYLNDGEMPIIPHCHILNDQDSLTLVEVLKSFNKDQKSRLENGFSARDLYVRGKFIKAFLLFAAHLYQSCIKLMKRQCPALCTTSLLSDIEDLAKPLLLRIDQFLGYLRAAVDKETDPSVCENLHLPAFASRCTISRDAINAFQPTLCLNRLKFPIADIKPWTTNYALFQLKYLVECVLEVTQRLPNSLKNFTSFILYLECIPYCGIDSSIPSSILSYNFLIYSLQDPKLHVISNSIYQNYAFKILAGVLKEMHILSISQCQFTEKNITEALFETDRYKDFQLNQLQPLFTDILMIYVKSYHQGQTRSHRSTKKILLCLSAFELSLRSIPLDELYFNFNSLQKFQNLFTVLIKCWRCLVKIREIRLGFNLEIFNFDESVVIIWYLCQLWLFVDKAHNEFQRSNSCDPFDENVTNALGLPSKDVTCLMLSIHMAAFKVHSFLRQTQTDKSNLSLNDSFLQRCCNRLEQINANVSLDFIQPDAFLKDLLKPADKHQSCAIELVKKSDELHRYLLKKYKNDSIIRKYLEQADTAILQLKSTIGYVFFPSHSESISPATYCLSPIPPFLKKI